MTDKYGLGDIVRMKKRHPCGSDFWTIIRVGMDIKLRCSGCDRIVMLPREKFETAAKAIVQRAAEETEEKNQDAVR